MNEIYTVTTCTQLTNHFGRPVLGEARTVGWYVFFKDADECVKENWGDIYEYTYSYAIIEKIEEGLYPNTERWFYKWDDEAKGYRPIEEPKFMNHFTNLSIG